MARTGTFHLYDRLTNGRLAELILNWQAEGVTFDEIALRLRSEGVVVSRETVRRWFKQIQPDKAAS